MKWRRHAPANTTAQAVMISSTLAPRDRSLTAGVVGSKRDLFVPIFAIGRVPGWVLQVLEQSENIILIRPLTFSSGPDARSYLTMKKRDA
jgi:Citrate synthase, C-terminal domain